MAARSGQLVQAQRHRNIKPLVLPAGTAGPTVLSLPEKTRDPSCHPPLSFTG
ncbi:hypothetical protein L842_0967 [Mycobacterium intracellulare MIN_052511_1280]|nr:hypothetical protein L842_0967 [Mycobacterium intracellulare MIN_052511_1280]